MRGRWGPCLPCAQGGGVGGSTGYQTLGSLGKLLYPLNLSFPLWKWGCWFPPPSCGRSTCSAVHILSGAVPGSPAVPRCHCCALWFEGGGPSQVECLEPLHSGSKENGNILATCCQPGLLNFRGPGMWMEKNILFHFCQMSA